MEIQHKAGVQTTLEFVTEDSKYVYYRANDIKPEFYAIYRYDVAAKKRELVFDQDGIWSVADWKKDGRLLLNKEVGSNMAELFEYNPATKALTPLFGQGEREDYDAVYGASEGEILVKTPKLSEFRRLYSWKAGEFTPISPDVKHDVEMFTVDRQKQRILYQLNEEGYSRLHGLDARTFKEEKLPAFPAADNVYIGATTHNGQFTTFGVDTGKGPIQSYSTDWKTRKLVAWHAGSSPRSTRLALPGKRWSRTRRATGRRSPCSCAAPPRATSPVRWSSTFTAAPRGSRRRASGPRRRPSSTPASSTWSPTCAAATATARPGSTPTTGRSGSRWSPTSRTSPSSLAPPGPTAARRPRLASTAAATAGTPPSSA